MLKEVVLASANTGKIAEIKEILKDLPMQFISQCAFHVSEIPETGTTFIENAIIKARHATLHAQLPALADDSGLTIPALDNAPGVYSARYAGDNASDDDRIAKVLAALAKLKNPDRSATFHCVIAFMENAADPAPKIFHGTWTGEILLAPQGKNGFGYDPIFYVPDAHCSAAELSPELKNTISHRAQALTQLRAYLMSGI